MPDLRAAAGSALKALGGGSSAALGGGGASSWETSLASLPRLISESSAAELRAAQPALTAATRPALLCGRPGVVGAACAVVLAGVRRGDAEGDALAIDLLPPVLDQATSFGGASPFADVCHCCALDCLMLLPRAAAVAVALHPGRTLASANQAATRRRLETLLLVLSRQPAAAADRLHHELAADALVKRRAPAVATELESLLTDARCPSLELCRHAYLALTERCPRALARGCVARLRLRRLRAFLDEATVGDAVALLPRGHDGLRRGSGLLQPRGHAGTIVWRGRTDLAPGEWFGVCLALPAGRHDGALRGRRYFRGELLQRLEEATHSFSEALEAQADPSPSGAGRAEAMARLMAAANEQTLLTRRLQQMVLE
ncbi:hypothetical protein EMIHUDRAFT_225089 [Emiliania huxleyi CCMP1516]|uniref:CAP-Gly domain-containing protein n=2 Tax=Emiliania huxleyi TaxID=2903 RepID=A0A0D3KPY8_EMIH1|nr:hypothetical protein EMIHUDRAFT_225089 [Emiliania huxleyi CCMP1516]EOD37823.1 hypothetical protein EMIHUDRAFT_225089 [Emiliania huxleyi CCMP1516]|eukprot:XP_005790252.1 hypothetical protein EMIHUDRAFT_225089 [Emiliania huxleyi CCMP1516]